MRLLRIALCGLLLAGCAVGYASPEKAVGVAFGQASISNCPRTAEGQVEPCPAIAGGALSHEGGGILGSLLGLVGLGARTAGP